MSVMMTLMMVDAEMEVLVSMSPTYVTGHARGC